MDTSELIVNSEEFRVLDYDLVSPNAIECIIESVENEPIRSIRDVYFRYRHAYDMAISSIEEYPICSTQTRLIINFNKNVEDKMNIFIE